MKSHSPLLPHRFRLIAVSLLMGVSLMTPARANNPWYVHCKKECVSCGESGCGSAPNTDTHETKSTFDTGDDETDQESAEAKAAELNAGGGDCIASMQPLQEPPPEEGDEEEGGGGTPSSSRFASRGVSQATYDRGNILFDGLPMGAVKKEVHPITQKLVPSQVAGKKSVFVITDLAGDKGYQVAEYLKSQLPSPSSNGVYPIPAEAAPLTVAKYRNPDTTPAGKMDVVYTQRHAQGSGVVVRTIRLESLPGATQWTRKYYLGDPVADSSLKPYREVSVTRTENAGGSETDHEITRERFGNNETDWVVVRDETKVMGFYKLGEPVALSVTKHTGTGSDLTTTRTYYTDRNKKESFNKPATMRRTDGQWANYTYQGSLVTGILVTKTVSGWLDNAAPAIGTAPNESANRVVTEIEAKNETGTFSREEKIQGVIVSKTWGERFKANSGELIEKSRVENGTATLTTIRTGYANSSSVSAVERGRLKSIQHPDGTVELHSYALQGENRVITVDSGAGGLSSVTDGTRTVSTYTKYDVLTKEVVSDIASGVELSAKEAIAFDVNGKVNRWAYNHNPDDYSESLDGCCGVDSTRTRDGVVTTYTRDALRRPKTAISHGITLTYVYGSKVIGGGTFPTTKVIQASGNLSLDQGTTVHDHAGNVIQQIRPDLDDDGNEEITSITRNFAARTTTTVNPDGVEIVQTEYADGQSKSTTGTAVPDSSQAIAIGTNLDGIPGAVRKSTNIRPSGTAAGDQITSSYETVGGLTLATKLNGVTTATYAYDNLARPILLTDGDGVKQHTAYNAQGEPYRRATSRDGNYSIELGIDTVSDSLRDVATVEGFGPAIRRVSKVWTDANTSVITSTTLQSPDGTKSSSSSLGVANPSTSLSASAIDRTDGSWTDTSTAPDGTKTTLTYLNWLPTTQARIDTAGNVIESVITGHDALRRPTTQTHSRTGLVTTNYAANGQVFSIDDHGRITGFKYDNMGNRVETTLPDNSKTHTVFSFSGQPIISWGSQTYPTYNTYDEQNRPLTLRTNPTLTPAGVPLNEGGFLTTWVYHPNGQLKQKLDATDKGASYTYTNGGRLHTREWARGVLTTYNYTASGQLFTATYSNEPAGQNTPDLEFSYDILDRRDTVKRDGVLHADYDYNSATLALSAEKLNQDTPLARTLNRYQDSLGRDTGFQLLNGTTIENQATYAHSATDGRLSQISNPQIPNHQFIYAYEPGSSLIASITSPVHTVTNTWEPTRNVLASKQNKVGTEVISQYDYTVNASGQRTGVNTSGTAFPALPSWLWGYDSLGQVISADNSVNASDRAYAYDSIGNRLFSEISNTQISNPPQASTTAYTPNPLNQYNAITTNGATINPTYDFDGNMLTGPVPGAAGLTPGIHAPADAELTWDAENRLVKAIVGGTSGTTVTYEYDHLSRLIARTVGSTTTRYLYDRWNRIAEYQEGTGVPPVLSKTRLWGLDLSGSMQGAGGVGGLLSESQILDSQISNYYPTFDGNGNVSEYLTAIGSISAHFEYDPFGNTVVNTDTANLFAYRFSTKPQDAETGLYYYGYRYYDPVAGRWSSKDPIEERGGINLYLFIDNNAICKLDILGLSIDIFDIDVESIQLSPIEMESDDTSVTLGETKDKWLYSGECTKQANGKFLLTMKGSLTISLFRNKDYSDDYVSKNKSNLSIAQHERKHATLSKNVFNASANFANNREGEYCDECCGLALLVAETSMGEAESLADLSHAEFDLAEYGVDHGIAQARVLYERASKLSNQAVQLFSEKCAK